MNQNKFQPDKKIFTICVYALLTTIIGVIFVRCIWNWESTTAMFSGLFSSLAPFLVGFLIAYIMGNLANSIETHFLTNTINIKSAQLRKILSLVSSYLIVIAILAAALFYIIPSFVNSISDMAANITVLYERLIDYIENLSQKYPNATVEYIESIIQDNLPQYINYFKEWAAGLAPSIANASFSIVRWLLNIIVATIVSVYMLVDKNILSRNMQRIVFALFKKSHAEYAWNTILRANEIFSGFIIGKTIDSLIIGALCLILMKMFNIGGTYAVVISIFIGITNMIPYFGPFIGAIPSALIILLAVSPRQAFAFVVLIFVLQQFDGNILGPRILGDKTGLRPIWIIFAISIGGWLGGVVGMFLGVPCVAVLSYIVDDLVARNLKNKDIDLPQVTNKKPESNEKLTKNLSTIISHIIERLHTKRDDKK